MKMCVNWKVIGGLSLAGLGLYALAPNLIGAAVPLLVLAACPLSMVLMMRAMSSGSRCKTDPDTASGERRSEAGDAEVARLRAELDQLRAEQADPTDTQVSSRGNIT